MFGNISVIKGVVSLSPHADTVKRPKPIKRIRQVAKTYSTTLVGLWFFRDFLDRKDQADSFESIH